MAHDDVLGTSDRDPFGFMTTSPLGSAVRTDRTNCGFRFIDGFTIGRNHTRRVITRSGHLSRRLTPRCFEHFCC